MKKINNTLFLILLLLTLGSRSIAQQTWDWSSYGVSIDLPDDFRVTNNNDNEFEAIGQGMELFMYLFEEDISLEEMKNATVQAATEMGIEEWSVVQDVTTRGFNGKYIAGFLDGSAVLLCGLIDPNNITNFIVVITFNDDDEVALDEAFYILNSLRRN